MKTFKTYAQRKWDLSSAAEILLRQEQLGTPMFLNTCDF